MKKIPKEDFGRAAGGIAVLIFMFLNFLGIKLPDIQVPVLLTIVPSDMTAIVFSFTAALLLFTLGWQVKYYAVAVFRKVRKKKGNT